MDLMAFDITGLPEDLVRRGTYATLIGDGITLDDLAGWSGTIAYEVLTGSGGGTAGVEAVTHDPEKLQTFRTGSCARSARLELIVSS